MKFHVLFLLAIFASFGNFSFLSAQAADTAVGQITSSPVESFANGISGDGRFVVFESVGNVATENPRNADGNREIFIFDYAQRRIFQITNTQSLLTDTTKAATLVSNIRVAIVNVRPSISNDGRWIAFGSNATTAFPGTTTLPPIISDTNPGSFNANSFTVNQSTANPSGDNSLTNDGNTEMWLYQIPAVAPANLSSGSEIPVTDLSAGTFLRVTNTLPSRLPVPGSTTGGAIIADDNRDASINDDGNYTSFVSNRDLAPNTAGGGNASPDGNDEIFTFVRNSNTLAQVTRTARGTAAAPIYNQSPTISGNGLRVAFLSNAENPVIGMSGASNADRNVEIFYTDLNVSGSPAAFQNSSAVGRQITTTTRTNLGDIVNILDFGRRMSRDGRYIAFDSFADLANENGGANQTSFALYLYDTTANSFRRIGPRSDADAGAAGGDVAHYPSFTDYDANGGNPQTLVFETRLNIRPDGTIPTAADEGQNSLAARPAQIYSYPLNTAPAAATFSRLTRFPAPNTFIASTQPITSNSLMRTAFNFSLTEVGTGNTDLNSEVYYLLKPNVIASQPANASLNFFTGASRIAVSASPVPSPSPSPSPQTPAAVQGVSPGMLAVVNYSSDANPRFTAQTAVGSLLRRFTLPIELSGVTLTINGAAAGLKSVSQNEVVFVVPPGLAAGTTGSTVYPVVINNNGTVFRSSVTIVPARPDVFTFSAIPGPGGRARIFNATNRVQTREPFSIRTTRIRGNRRLVQTVLRLHLTGVDNVAAAAISIRIGSRTITTTNAPVLREPGIYTIDFPLPSELRGAGDVPVVVTVTLNGVTYQSRLEDTAPRTSIL